jgi:predicted nuclease with RNAse H fold
MSIVAGIDVGGIRRGFHVAVVHAESGEFLALQNLHLAEDIARLLMGFSELECVAIDCPPCAQIDGPRTRLAERQVNQAGFKVQWTRRKPMAADEWMQNGERVWKNVRNSMGQVQIIETFPTVVSSRLAECDWKLPLSLLKGGVIERSGYKDFVDASLCAWVAMRYLKGEALSFGSDGEDMDELGLIWY